MINPELLFVNLFCCISLHLPVSADAPDTAVIHIAYLNTAGRRAGMHNLVISYVNTHMSVIADHISRHLFRIADCSAAPSLCAGSTGKGDSEMGMHRHGKTRTVCPIGQARSAIYIGISHKLQSIGCDGRSASAP